MKKAGNRGESGERPANGRGDDLDNRVRPTSRRGFLKTAMAAGFGMLIINPFQGSAPLRGDETPPSCGEPIAGDPQGRVWTDQECTLQNGPDKDCQGLTAVDPFEVYQDDGCGGTTVDNPFAKFHSDMDCAITRTTGVGQAGTDGDCGKGPELLFGYHRDEYCGHVYGVDKIETDESCAKSAGVYGTISDARCGRLVLPDAKARYEDGDCGQYSEWVDPIWFVHLVDHVCATTVPASEPTAHYSDSRCGVVTILDTEQVAVDMDCGLASAAGEPHVDQDCGRLNSLGQVHSDNGATDD